MSRRHRTNELNDDTWKEYLDTLASMDVQRLTEIEQEIYDQYLEKDKLLGIG